jgi:hypothetical protein
MKKLFLSNVAELNITKQGFDPIAELFNIPKVRRTLVFQKFEEGKAPNVYLDHMYNRLRKAAQENDYKKFDGIATTLISRSASFRLVAYSKVDPTWFTRTPSFFMKSWKKLTALCNNLSTDLKYSRFWIDKANGRKRPLGVPTLEWRAYMYMYTVILNIAAEEEGILQDFQHGGRPKKGLKTAWLDIIERVLNKPYIYEFDIKGFFDNIDQTSIRDALLITGFPQGLTYKIMEMLLKGPDSYHMSPKPNKPFEMKQTMKLMQSSMKQAAVLASFMGNDLATITEPMTGKKLINESYEISSDPSAQQYDIEQNLNIRGSGVPQGASFSPHLACLGTHLWIPERTQLNNLIMYMDDGLLFGDTLEEVTQAKEDLEIGLQAMGVQLSEAKSKWIKSPEHNENLKFLGLEYNFETKRIRAATRNGSTTEFPSIDFEKVMKLFPLARFKTSKESENDKARLINMTLENKYLEIGSKYGLLGCFISHAQSPWTDPMYRKLEIELGIERAIYKMNKPKALIWHFQDVMPFYPTEGAIYIASSVAVINGLARIRSNSKLSNERNSPGASNLAPNIGKRVAVPIVSQYEFD